MLCHTREQVRSVLDLFCDVERHEGRWRGAYHPVDCYTCLVVVLWVLVPRRSTHLCRRLTRHQVRDSSRFDHRVSCLATLTMCCTLPDSALDQLVEGQLGCVLHFHLLAVEAQIELSLLGLTLITLLCPLDPLQFLEGAGTWLVVVRVGSIRYYQGLGCELSFLNLELLPLNQPSLDLFRCIRQLTVRSCRLCRHLFLQLSKLGQPTVLLLL